MAIKRDSTTIDGRAFVRTYSDANMHVMRDGVLYQDALDPAEYADARVYVESDVPLEQETTTDNDAYALAGRIMLGEEV
jgi:hypothetical protein